MNRDDRPVVLLARASEQTNALYHWLARRHPTRVVLEDAPPLLPFLRRRIQRLGLRRVLGQVAFGVYDRLLLRPRSRDRAAAIASAAGLRADPIPEDAVAPVPSANSDEARAALRAAAPRAVVVHGTRILTPRTLGCVDAPFLNLHAGTTPAYRGVHGGYWARVHGDPPGITLHLVDEGIDTGRVLAQRTVEATPEDTLRTLPWLQFAAILPDLEDALAGTLPPREAPPAAPSRLWSHPTLWEYLRHRRRGVR